MLKLESFPIAKIYVPVKRRATLKEAVVHEIAESILEVGQQAPIRVRQDGDRYVLVEGLHRLEACKALGEETILGFLVSARAEPQEAGSPYEAELDALRLKTERLRKLRLAKTAEERSSADSVTPLKQPTATDARNHNKRSKLAAKSQSALAEWLARRERDGFRN